MTSPTRCASHLAAKAAEFAEASGVAVQHVCVEGDAATQQLIAAQQAPAEAPADLFFGGPTATCGH